LTRRVYEINYAAISFDRWRENPDSGTETPMGIFHIDEIKTGLTLAEDVLTPQGMKIASKESEITDRHLKAFKAWGITEVSIQGQKTPERRIGKRRLSCGLDCQVAVEEIDRIFSKTDRAHPVISALYETVVKNVTVD
jgi:hypothetical protein